MRIDIFNVGHGQCAVITAPNGRRMMLDCGDRWGDDRFWTPSLHFFRQTIDLLALMNLDEDHFRDFKNVMHDCTSLGFSAIRPSARASSRRSRRMAWDPARKLSPPGLPN